MPDNGIGLSPSLCGPVTWWSPITQEPVSLGHFVQVIHQRLEAAERVITFATVRSDVGDVVDHDQCRVVLVERVYACRDDSITSSDGDAL